MSEPSLPLSLLVAARVVARGGDLDSKLRALEGHAAAAANGAAVAFLLLDTEATTAVSIDGQTTMALTDGGVELVSVVQERVPTVVPVMPAPLGAWLPGARSGLLLPLVTGNGEGTAVEGVLALGWESQRPPLSDPPDALVALADLAAVAIHQARLHSTAWERSDHADRLLHTDRLTGLANRVTFERMLELEIARAARQGSPLAVALFDVNSLAAIGDQHGARVVDQVLRHVASAIAERVRLLDTVARYGEGEFVVIAPGDGGGIVALRLRDAISQLPPIGETKVSVSAAVVHHPSDGATASELVAAAEAALAEARAGGPGHVVGVQDATA